ncbi:hypothetical protein [Enterococcus faecium]|uniref:hypothetical protein n=1 Tax=Enterococcus faecium TaxID=1352 RepID=UPI0021FE9D86|nr:hypothetical protein [Enterococcus faecium]BDP48462.1 hypothetical protein EfmJHP9_33320 [Enterococcus faecium]
MKQDIDYKYDGETYEETVLYSRKVTINHIDEKDKHLKGKIDGKDIVLNTPYHISLSYSGTFCECGSDSN